MTEYVDSWPDMKAKAAGNAFIKRVERIKLLSNDKQKNRQLRVKLFQRKTESLCYLSNEDTGDAVRIVPFWVGWSKQLLPFTLFKAVQEGWIEDVLQDL